MKHLTYYVSACAILVLVTLFLLIKTVTQDVSVKDIEKAIPTENDNTFATAAISAKNWTDLPLKIPSGFSISYFAKTLSGARILALDPRGNVIVSLTQVWKIAILWEIDKSWKASKIKTILSNLSKPHWLLITGTGTQTKLYVAETDKITRYDYDVDKLEATKPKKIQELPSNGRHFTRTLLGLPDGNILVSIWSSCDACIEKDGNRASVLIMKPDGTEVKKYATWLRNTVFMRLNHRTNEVWATEMWRDYQGDDLPPDEINILKSWGFYGWPFCYGKKIPDISFETGTNNRCSTSTPSLIDIPAHSAPLGLAFIPDNWPKKYQWDLLVAYHGSWNRSIPTGYKIVRMRFDSEGNYTGSEDFITGWISNGKIQGRPVDLLFAPDGVLYISDDKIWAIYKMAPH